MLTNLTLEDCQAMCIRAEKYFCRSIEYDEMTKQCTISEEDSISQRDDIGLASSPSHHFYDFTCLDSRKYIFIHKICIAIPWVVTVLFT